MTTRTGLRASLAAVIMAVVASACPGPRERPVAPTPAGPPPAGTIRVAYPSEPPTLDPTGPGGTSAATRDVLRTVLPSLFTLDENLRPVPSLAERWPSDAEMTFDPFTVTIRLREAAWSDGTPITAADVRFTWERLRSGPSAGRYRPLTDVVVGEDPRALQLRFDRPLRRWWSLFSVDDVILPAHAYGEQWDAGPTVSGGPFAFEGAEPGLKIRLRRNDKWWGPPAQAEAIEILFVGDDERRLELLERGEVDVVVAEGEANFGRRARARGLDPSGAWGPSWWELGFNFERLGRNAEAFSAAVTQALDRTLPAEMLEDSGQVMNGLPGRFPRPGARRPGGLPAIPGPWPGGGDVEAARRTLSAAGVDPDELEVSLAYASGSSAAAGMARFVHFALRPLGVRLELIGIEGSRFEREWVPSGRADAYIVLRRGSDAPDAPAYLPDALPPGRTAGTEALVAAARTASERSLRAGPLTGLDGPAWDAAEAHLASSRSVVPLTRVRSWTVGRGVEGLQTLGTSMGPLWNAHLWRLAR